MTKKELAERINVDPKTIRNWETTKPELIKLINLGLEAEKQLEKMNLTSSKNLASSELGLTKIIKLGLATEEHIEKVQNIIEDQK